MVDCKNCEARIDRKTESHVYLNELLFCCYDCAVEFVNGVEQFEMLAEVFYQSTRPPPRRFDSL